MGVRAIVVAILGQGASEKEQMGQGTERQRKSPASEELTFRGQRNSPKDVSSQKVAIPKAQQSEGGHSRGRSLGHPYTGLLRGGRGGEASPTEQGLAPGRKGASPLRDRHGWEWTLVLRSLPHGSTWSQTTWVQIPAATPRQL